MTDLEKKIIEAVNQKKSDMEKYDKDRKAEYDEYMKKAAIQSVEFWKKDFEHRAQWSLSFQKHGYDFLEAWKNTIAKAMYGRIYHEWHSAQAGRYPGTGHGAYVTTELNEKEIEIINKVFDGMVKKGYFRISKSGKQAKLVK